MTTGERAERVAWGSGAKYSDGTAATVRKLTEAAIREAVAEERERCAKVAEGWSLFPNDPSWDHTQTGGEHGSVCIGIAAAIRKG